VTINPLYDQLVDLAQQSGGILSGQQVKDFIGSAIKDLDNFELFDESNPSKLIKTYKAIVLYGGSIDGVYTGNIAADLSARSAGELR
jgi:hypothetical protein